MWQAEADTELTLSASPATAVGQLTLYERCFNLYEIVKSRGNFGSWECLENVHCFSVPLEAATLVFLETVISSCYWL